MTHTTINTVQEWRVAQTAAATSQAVLVLLYESNTDNTFSQDFMDAAVTRWVEAIKTAATAPYALRDAVIRHKAYAFSLLTSSGRSGSSEAFKKTLGNYCFAKEVEMLANGLTEDERNQQTYHLDVSYYLEAASGYYCNQLLNLADGGNRELIPQNHWSYERLVELTAKLEDRKMFDEIFVARAGIIYSFLAISGMAFKPEEQQMHWLQSANALLNELNNRPVVVA